MCKEQKTGIPRYYTLQQQRKKVNNNASLALSISLIDRCVFSLSRSLIVEPRHNGSFVPFSQLRV